MHTHHLVCPEKKEERKGIDAAAAAAAIRTTQSTVLGYNGKVSSPLYNRAGALAPLYKRSRGEMPPNKVYAVKAYGAGIVMLKTVSWHCAFSSYGHTRTFMLPLIPANFAQFLQIILPKVNDLPVTPYILTRTSGIEH